jgi:hypothetical protein
MMKKKSLFKKEYSVGDIVTLLRDHDISKKEIKNLSVKITGWVKDVDIALKKEIKLIDNLHKKGLVIDIKNINLLANKKIIPGDKVAVIAKITVTKESIKLVLENIKVKRE